MKTEASKNALNYQLSSGKLQGDKMRIMKLFERKDRINLRYISIVLDMPYQTASGRLSDLNDMGLIEVDNKMKYTRDSFYKLSENPELIKKQREDQKIKHMIKRLKTLGYEVKKYCKCVDCKCKNQNQ